jgi:hypothetical protein
VSLWSSSWLSTWLKDMIRSTSGSFKLTTSHQQSLVSLLFLTELTPRTQRLQQLPLRTLTTFLRWIRSKMEDSSFTSSVSYSLSNFLAIMYAFYGISLATQNFVNPSIDIIKASGAVIILLFHI